MTRLPLAATWGNCAVRRGVNGNSGTRGPARRVSAVSRIAAAGLASWLGAAATIASAADTEGSATPPPPEPTTVEGNVAGESTFIEPPPFPGPDIGDAFRIQAETFAAPDASIGSGHVSVVRPEFGLRATWPVNDRLVLRIVTRAAESRYRFRGDVWGATVAHPLGPFPDADQLIGDRLDLHAARVAFEGAYRLSDDTRWFADTEQWAVLGSANIGSRWEDGAFDSGLAAGGALGLGYEIPKVFRVALGVSLGTPLNNAELDAAPFFSLRWRPIERVTVRTRELGLQVEVDLTPSFEAYLTGFRSSDGYRLRDRFGPLGDLSFRDRQVRLGVGFDWSLVDWLRLGLEAGALTDRSLRVREEDLGTLMSRRADSSAYFEVRFEVRL
jgi:hypothetical protein